MRFKFEEKAKVGTLYLLGVISKNDRSELLSLLEKTSSMCTELKIDISGVERISDENLKLLTSFADSDIKGAEKLLHSEKKVSKHFSKNSSASV